MKRIDPPIRVSQRIPVELLAGALEECPPRRMFNFSPCFDEKTQRTCLLAEECPGIENCELVSQMS